MKIALPTDWSRMFLLGLNASPRAEFGGNTVPMPSLALQVFEPLDTVIAEDIRGRQIGAFLGSPVDPEAGRVLSGRVTVEGIDLERAANGAELDAAIERAVYRLTGSFLFVLDVPGARRLYLDACGSLSAVWDPETRQAAAISSQLVPTKELESRFEQELYQTLRVDRDGWFPAGLTAHAGIRRLMPNHYLDLDTGIAVRHWPSAEIPRDPDPEAACGRILGSVRQTLAALAAEAPLSVALTAGNETRMILAGSHGLAGDLEFVTVAAEGAELDRIRAQELAARFKLRHRLIPLVLAEPAGQADWQARAGYAVGGPHIRTHPTIRQLRTRPYFVGGLGGEIGRGFFWRPTDHDATAINAAGIWARMGMPQHPRGIAAVETWLSELRRDLGDLPTLLVLDLAYLEIRMGCWGFALSYTNADPVDMHPLIGRESFAAMLSLPPEWRRMKNRTNRMIQHVIRQGWPELLEFPISIYGDWRDYANFLRRLRRQPHLVAKKLRKALN